MVEIVFNTDKCNDSETKVVLAFGSLNPETFAEFLTDSELKALSAAAERHNFKGDNGKFIAIDTAESQVICAGLGSDPTQHDFKNCGGKLYALLKKSSSAVINICRPAEGGQTREDIAYNIAFGIELASYSFDKYCTKRKPEDFPKLERICFAPSLQKDGYAPFSALASGVRYARDLTNEPANNMTPLIMAEDIKRLAYLGLEIDILDEDRMKAEEFNLALSVAQGSCNPPRIAVIKWKGKPSEKSFALGLVGKGVTFDSGGISLKPGAGMWDMKQDMAGSAAVVGAMKTAALQKLPCNVVAVVGLVENMPSGSATRPGDVIRSMSGQTVEVLNTDAEGRLVLADCLWYIQKTFDVKTVLDIATLTGAIMVALGTEMAGIMGNDQTLIDKISKAGQTSGEKVWQLPLSKEYDKMMNSDIADMKNISESRNAGSITAGCFLQRFIQEDVQWAHLDIAGMDKETKGKPLTPKGATGFGVMLFNQIMQNL